MTRHVTVGLDESPEGLAAARWAAREAMLRDAPLHLVHVEEWPVTPEIPQTFTQTLAERYEALLRDTADQARRDHPGLEVTTEVVQGRAIDELTHAADESVVTALGSRGLGSLVGFLIGSVSLGVVAKTRSPVVLVRPEGTDAASPAEGASHGSPGVVLGVDVSHPCDPLLAFAFEQAARRSSGLQVVHAWSLPATYTYAAILDPSVGSGVGQHAAQELNDMLRPWRERFPQVSVSETLVMAPPASELVQASQGAELVVVGRRGSRQVGPHIGHVAHAVIHHASAPVAVVPV
ncbi:MULTISPECIES: universal stress protein [unclassified Streptomyces]|uniref:universal stress protein n=1 Tax=unclassified Streptomyces TaxID=2593676 RepID=UPI0008238B99|nr:MULTISPECIES: universal stress protein [unclassified Streptomyces]MYT99461.1 universal stress protein [Streptomyces sp. SID8350]SCK19969.1 Nucleotide-binding universal stress protein, UspA family [Streptomyces sp. AmelKG-D3]